MKLAIIIMLISLLMSVVIDLYNLHDMSKRLRRLERELERLETETNKRLTKLEREAHGNSNTNNAN